MIEPEEKYPMCGFGWPQLCVLEEAGRASQRCQEGPWRAQHAPDEIFHMSQPGAFRENISWFVDTPKLFLVSFSLIE